SGAAGPARLRGCSKGRFLVRSKERLMFGKTAGVLLAAAVFCGFAAAEEFGAMITRVNGDQVTFYKTPTNPRAKVQKGKTITLSAKDAVVFHGKIQFNKDAKKVEIVPGDAIDGGLANDVFELRGKASIAARITTSDDGMSIDRILSLKPGAKK